MGSICSGRIWGYSALAAVLSVTGLQCTSANPFALGLGIDLSRTAKNVQQLCPADIDSDGHLDVLVVSFDDGKYIIEFSRLHQSPRDPVTPRPRGRRGWHQGARPFHHRTGELLPLCG